jgi:hypothetical protein
LHTGIPVTAAVPGEGPQEKEEEEMIFQWRETDARA